MHTPHPYFVGQPCEAVVGPADALGFCGEPARFIYYGIMPDGMKPKELARRGHPCTALFCPDHAKSLAHDWSWLIKDGKIRIERLDMQILRLHCRKCLAFTKIAWDTDAPQGFPGEIQFCPRCGNNQIAGVDPEADYWDIMSESFDNMPVQLLQLLFHDWDRVRYVKFADFVDAQIKAFDTTGELIPEVEV